MQNLGWNAITANGDNFYDCLFALLHLFSKFFPKRRDPFSKGDKDSFHWQIWQTQIYFLADLLV